MRGIAPDGGLYVPSSFPSIDIKDPQLREFSYRQLAEYILSLFITDFSPQELSACVQGAYDEKFRDKEIAPAHSCGEAHFIELHHGRTLDLRIWPSPFCRSSLPRRLKSSV